MAEMPRVKAKRRERRCQQNFEFRISKSEFSNVRNQNGTNVNAGDTGVVIPISKATAMIYGSVTASFCCEGFGLKRTTQIKRAQIDQRVKELEKLTKF